MDAKTIRLLTRAYEELRDYPTVADLNHSTRLDALKERIAERRLARAGLLREIAAAVNRKGRNLPDGDNLTAARRYLDSIKDADPALAMACLSLAKAVDQSPGNANLWRQYLDAAKALRSTNGTQESETDDFAKLMAALHAPMGDPAPTRKANVRRPSRSNHADDGKGTDAMAADGLGRGARNPA